ncbi:hypothetical protein [Paenibacillus sp. PAMC21692]|uniref:hypothetical protein n=1 Tax=Paenibacillus sp. PAMC21692 TaxID=2762320 RepID=UPI00164ECF83|nr:hypothetical protein [Paenibacillus sp. PAMC21692]QNK57438.1 hypothetical protein H7F31_00080 [Paenibacillus sp. PAMC21692]
MDYPIKISVAQINYNPAYFSGGCDLLVEPFGDNSTFVTKVKNEVFYQLSDKLKVRYLKWLQTKIFAIIDAALKQSTDILVFPEYSIPHFLLKEVFEYVKTSQLVVVAGTHMISSRCFPVYSDLGIAYNDDYIGCAAAPVLNLNGTNDLIFKYSRSKWESSLEFPKGENRHWVSFEKNGHLVNLGVFICIDGLRKSFHDTEKELAVIIIPSWSPSVEPFNAAAFQAIYNELPLVYANTSYIGGSRIFAPFPETDGHWFSEKQGTKELSKNSEGLVTVCIDLNNVRRSAATVREHVTARITDVSNLVYLYNIDGEEVLTNLEKLSGKYDEHIINNLLRNCSDEVVRRKLNEIIHQERMGLLRGEKLIQLTSYIAVSEITYSDLVQEQAETTLRHITSHPELLSEKDILATLSAVSTKSLQIISNVNNEIDKPKSEERPFFDRQSELVKLRNFINAESDKLLIIQGVRGIGKTFLVEQIPRRILPPNNQWKRINIKFSVGMGFPLFIDDVAFQLGLRDKFIESNEEQLYLHIRKVLESFEGYRAGMIIVDDFHHILDKEGSFVDHRFLIFIDEFLKRVAVNKKLILITNRHISLNGQIGFFSSMTLRGLNEESIVSIVDYHYKNITGRVESITISDSLLRYLYGNPLAAVITAQYLQHHSIDSLNHTTDLFKRFQEQFITNLLSEVRFKPEEKELLDFISTSKEDVSSQIIYKWKSGIYNVVDSLCSQFILEYNAEKDVYSIHPLVRDYFYNQLDLHVRVSYHHKFAEVNEDTIREFESKEEPVPPKYISELIYHFAGSLQIDKLSSYKSQYLDELKPIADALFKNKKYDKALEYYLILNEISYIKRLDVTEKLFMCYGNLGRWREARDFFEKTVSIKNASYLYAKYAELLAVKTREFAEAESFVLTGEEIYISSNSKRKWEYAKIKYTLGRIRERQGNDRDSQGLYKEALSFDPTNLYYMFRYAKCLIKNGKDASDIIEGGLKIRNDYPPLLTLQSEDYQVMDEDQEEEDYLEEEYIERDI